MSELRNRILASMREPGKAFELDLDDKKVPQELQPLGKAWKLTPVDHDPFAPPDEPKKKS